MTPEAACQLLTEDRAALILTEPFLGQLALQLEVAADPGIRTIACDGRCVCFCPRFVASLSTAHRRFALAHVIWHVALLHSWRRAGRAASVWDLAIDHEVNSVLDAHHELPAWAAWLEDCAGASAEAVYARWLDGADPPGRSPLADEHRPIDRSLQSIWTDRVLSAAIRIEQAGGRLPGAAARLVATLRSPTLPWRDLLGRYVASAVGDRRVWLPPNRRHVHQGLYLPSRSEPGLHVAVAIDTSASTASVQEAFASEVLGITRSFGRYRLTVVQGDARVQHVATYSQDDPPPPATMLVRGFGGTDFRPVFAHLAEARIQPSVLVWFTDGHGSAPIDPPPYPVLWAIAPGGRSPTLWGQVVQITP